MGVCWPLWQKAQALEMIEIINLILCDCLARYIVYPSTTCSTERSVIIFAASENTAPSSWHLPRQQM